MNKGSGHSRRILKRTCSPSDLLVSLPALSKNSTTSSDHTSFLGLNYFLTVTSDLSIVCLPVVTLEALFSIFYIMRLYALISNRCGMMMLISFLAHTLLNMVIEAEYAHWGQSHYDIESLNYRGSPTSTVSTSTISTSTNFIAIGIKLVLVGD